MHLGGTWRATTADDDLRRVFPDPDLDDRGWVEVTVPHHWRSTAEFATSDGPLLYRRRFDNPAPAGADDGDRRSWLHLDGMFYQGDVWLDRAYLGDTEGYFFPHVFEVTDALRQQADHLLAVEVACHRPADRRAKRNLTGVFQHWDCFDQDWNPGGIWRPVHLSESGPVRIAKLRVLCVEARAERATVEVQASLDAKQACVVTIETTIVPAPPASPPSPSTWAGPARPARSAAASRDVEHPLAAGSNVVRWRMVVEQPDLWWPHALGGQPLYDLTMTVDLDSVASDRRTVRTGLRQFRMKDFIATVNGERLFLKGSNQGPNRRALGEATPEELDRDIVQAREAGLDLLRVHGHISRPELYGAADRHGVLLWQDLPLQWGYQRGVRQQAVRQAIEAVDLLGHHPSVVIWCGHNEPLAIDTAEQFLRPEPLGAAPRAATPPGASPAADAPAARPAAPAEPNALRLALRFLAAQILPTWNKTVLDRSIQRALEKADSSRPVIAHSGIFPHPAWGTDSHLFFGWYGGNERDLPSVIAHVPVLARFVSEFGAQAVPSTADFCQPEKWPSLDWPHLAWAHGLQKTLFDQYVPPGDYETFGAWRDATQAYQAQLIRFHIETLRRLKYRPTGGFCQFCLADGQPAVSWSVLDHERAPKSGYHALVAACAPVIVVADRPAASYRPGDGIRLDVHVVSDLRVPVTSGLVTATLAWPGGSTSWTFSGAVDADACARVGTLDLMAPDAPGPLTLDLVLDHPGGQIRNRYDSAIVR